MCRLFNSKQKWRLLNLANREAALLKRAISTNPDKGILQLPTEGAVKCIQYHLQVIMFESKQPIISDLTLIM